MDKFEYNLLIKRICMEQEIIDSGIKGSACSQLDCSNCDNLVKCYMDISKNDENEDINYGGYETETHY